MNTEIRTGKNGGRTKGTADLASIANYNMPRPNYYI